MDEEGEGARTSSRETSLSSFLSALVVAGGTDGGARVSCLGYCAMDSSRAGIEATCGLCCASFCFSRFTA